MLRPLEIEDLDEVVSLHNDLKIKTLTLSWPLPVTRDACRGWIAARSNSPDDATWAVSSDTGLFWGVARIFDLDRLSRRAEIGLYLRPDVRGRGIGSDVVNLLKAWSFDFFGLHRLEARVLAANVTALTLFERCGFDREGTLRDREYRLGDYHDVVLFGTVVPT